MSLHEAPNVLEKVPDFMSPDEAKELSQQIAKVTILSSSWYGDLIEKMKSSALDYLSRWEIAPSKIECLGVPGSFELPLAAELCARESDLVIVLGCVVRGETPHFDFVCTEVSRSLMEFSVRNKKPLGFGVLTVNNLEQAMQREKKGAEAAQAALFMYWMKEKRKRLD